MRDKFSDDTVLVDISDSDVDYSDVLLITRLHANVIGVDLVGWFGAFSVCAFFWLVLFSLLACVWGKRVCFFLSFSVILFCFTRFVWLKGFFVCGFWVGRW